MRNTDIYLAGVGDHKQVVETVCETELCPSSRDATSSQQTVENSLTYDVNERNMVGWEGTQNRCSGV
jgi:hypothetical protein